jgi:prophage regulatory protein
MSPAILRKPEVVRRTGLSAATIRRLELAGRFPKRLQLSTMAVGWDEREVSAWIDGRTAARAHDGANLAGANIGCPTGESLGAWVLDVDVPKEPDKADGR